MARLLVRLKLLLLANALRSSNRAKASFMTSTAFAVLTALGMFALLASLHGQRAAVDLTSVMFIVFAFGWLIMPLLAFGLDSTLDPATMALYPLRTRPLAIGLLAALGAALGLSNVITVTGACPMAKRVGTPIYTAAPGYGSSRVAATIGTLLGIPVLVTPVIVAAVLSAGAPLAIRAPVLTVGAACYGLALAWAGVRIAATAGEHKMPELCQVALASKL